VIVDHRNPNFFSHRSDFIPPTFLKRAVVLAPLRNCGWPCSA
jgi:hypothetical protein